MYCLDTNIIIDIFRGEEKVISKIEDIWGKSIFITSITACELYKGAYGHKNSEDKIKIVNEFIKNVEIVSEDQMSCKEFGRIWQNLRKKGSQIGDFDILIGSIVKTNNLIFVTKDKHFKKIDMEVLII